MHSLVRVAAAATWLCTAAAIAGTAAPTPTAKAVKATKHISIKFQGTLREALKAIAESSGINLVITGELKEPAEVYVRDVSGEEALQIVADAHNLKVHRQGSIWTIRPLTHDEVMAKSHDGHGDDGDGDGEEADDAEDSDEPLDSSRAASREAMAVPASPPAPPVAPTPPSEEELLGDSPPDPVADPKAFQRYIERRVQKDMRVKMLRKQRGHSNSDDLEGSGHLVVEEDQTFDDVVTYGGPLDVKGHIKGDAIAYGGGVHLYSTAEVEGDVVAFGGGITKDDGASVDGEEVAFGSGGLGTVMGKTLPKIIRAEKHEEHDHKPDPGSSLPAFLAWFAVLFGSGFLAMMFAPNRMKLLEAELRSNPLRCGITGMLGGLLGLPTLSVVLAVTVVGIPVIPVLWVVAAVGALMGSAALANEIGTRLPLQNVRKTQAVVLALGVLVMELVGLIPVLGVLTWCAVGFLALGAVIRSRFGTRHQGIPQPV